MHYDYGFRIYNPSIAKFLSVDPLTKEYPMYTPYQFGANTPIAAIDLDGAEAFIKITGTYWLDQFKNKINDDDDVEGAIGFAFKAARETSLDDLETDKARRYAQTEKGGWKNGKPASFNYVDSEVGGVVIMGPDDEILFARLNINKEDNWYDPIFEYIGMFEDGGGGIQFTVRGSGLSKPGVHVRTGNAEGTMEINDLLAVINATGSAAKSKPVSLKTTKDAFEAIKQIIDGAKIIQDLDLEEYVENKGLDEGIQRGNIQPDPDENFICPTCKESFSSSDTAKHNDELERDYGPFEKQKR